MLLHPRVLGLSLLLVAPIAAAGPPPKSHAQHAGPGHPKTASFAPVAHRVVVGRSVGSPTDGHLIGGAHLPDAPYLRIVPVYAGGDARWGLEPLVGMIDRAARALRKQFPESILSIGHLSRAGGGNIDRHASHESGRDADIGFFVKNQQGKSIYADHFVAFKGDGTASSWPGAQFDDARNWALVSSIVSDTSARVTHIFVAMPLRTRLLQYAEKIGAPPALRSRAAELMAQPRGSLPHDDHFHVRIACPPGMDKCIEQPLPRKHPHGALARSHGAHPAPSSSHVASHAPGHGDAKPPTKHEKAGVTEGRGHVGELEGAEPPRTRESEKTEAKSESVPNLAPMVPGLDSVIIPAPLTSTQPESPRSRSEDKPEDRPTPPPFIIDDPDGVLEPR